MGPITLVDKSSIEGLKQGQITYLDRYYSLVVSPILLRELHSMLAKEPEPGKNWEQKLSVLASRVDAVDSHIPPNALLMMRESLLGNQVPLNGQIPLSGGTRVRARDGSFGIIYDEPKEKQLLRKWQRKDFSQEDRELANAIRSSDHSVDLVDYQAKLKDHLKHFPRSNSLVELMAWLDETYFKSAGPDFHLVMACSGILTQSEISGVLKKYKESNVPLSEFAPYAFYCYRVNTLYIVGLSQELVPSSKAGKSHLDLQYLYYLPFCMCFTSGDNFLLNASAALKRADQTIISQKELYADLSAIQSHFESPQPDHGKNTNHKRGQHPPENVKGCTNAIWEKYMRPRSELSDSPIQLTKEQQKEMVKEINRLLKESVIVDGPGDGKPRTEERPKLSIAERNIKFLSGVTEIIEAHQIDDWHEIRKKFGKEHVKKIYDLHADLWHPSDPIRELAEEIASQKDLKVLYLGEVDPQDTIEQLWRWSLYFDRILIPDPFHSPWARQHDYNPIANPEQFVPDTLKLAYLMMMTYPLQASGVLMFVPDPSDFDPILKKAFIDICSKKPRDIILENMLEREKERIAKKAHVMTLRRLARLPDDRRARMAKNMFPELDQAILGKVLDQIIKSDPLCPVTDSSEGELIINRTGANFESSVLLSTLYGAVPLSTLESRTAEFRDKVEGNNKGQLATRLGKLKVFLSYSPIFTSFARDNGALKAFRQLLCEELKGEGSISDKAVNAVIDSAEEDAEFLAKVFVSKSGDDEKLVWKESKIELLRNLNGFSSDLAMEYLSKYDPNLARRLPRFCFGVPPTEADEKPF